LLAQAGYTEANPLKISLSFRNVPRSYLPSPDKVAQEIQAQLKEVGVEVTLEEMESAAFIDATAAGQKGFYLLGWNADYPDATNFFDYHFANTSNQQFGAVYQDIVDEINAAAKLSDVAARQAHYDKVNQLLKDKVVMVPVAHGGSAVAYQANVEGAHASPLGNERFSVMDNGTDQFVWIQNGELPPCGARMRPMVKHCAPASRLMNLCSRSRSEKQKWNLHWLRALTPILMPPSTPSTSARA